MTKRPFSYGARFTSPVLNNDRASQDIVIGSDADFIVDFIESIGTTGVRVEMFWNSDLRFSNNIVDAAFFGQGLNRLPVKGYLVPRSATVTVNITNETGATLNYFEIRLQGTKVIEDSEF